jgi:DNA-3-methyladenine glycosylase I
MVRTGDFTVTDYKAIFEAIKESLYTNSSTPAKLKESIDWTRDRTYENVVKQYPTDETFNEYFYRLLVAVTFYSGFKASTVDKKLPAIYKCFPNIETAATLSDEDLEQIREREDVIRHKYKLKACRDNAQMMLKVIEGIGSIKDLIESYKPFDSFENLMLLNEALRARFAYISHITVFHVMTDLGLYVLKPDLVITRTFARLGLIANRQCELHAIIQGQEFAKTMDCSMRYIDAVFVAYGQKGNWGGAPGICSNKPKCHLCTAKSLCKYGKEQSDV